MKLLAKLMSFISITLTVMVILFAGLFTVPKLFGITPYIVESGSMEPVIHTGAVAFINTKDTEIEVGNIVTYAVGNDTGKLVTHRVVRQDGEQWITKGDANDTEDLTPVENSQVIGTYLFSIPQVGYLLSNPRKIAVVATIWLVTLNGLSAFLSWYVRKEEGA